MTSRNSVKKETKISIGKRIVVGLVLLSEKQRYQLKLLVAAAAAALQWLIHSDMCVMLLNIYICWLLF